MLRTEALSRIAAGGNRKVVVTYPEALFEKVILSKSISDQIIRIKQAETIDVTGMLGQFVDLGFSRTDFVYEPGQFAIRGGILDIYSFGNEKPYRIELFGNEVDSIRIFDPETQLSEKRLLQVNIIPNLTYRETEAGFHAGDEEKSLFPNSCPVNRSFGSTSGPLSVKESNNSRKTCRSTSNYCKADRSRLAKMKRTCRNRPV